MTNCIHFSCLCLGSYRLIPIGRSIPFKDWLPGLSSVLTAIHHAHAGDNDISVWCSANAEKIEVGRDAPAGPVFSAVGGEQQLSFLRSPAQQRESLESSAASILLYIGELCAAAASLCACAIVCTVRAAMRRRENIGVQCCGQAEDCCCATFCNPCTQCQLLRHEKEGLAKPVGYSLCLDTAFPV